LSNWSNLVPGAGQPDRAGMGRTATRTNVYNVTADGT
jgi:hypothetical protein